jgi:hypothetical protein
MAVGHHDGGDCELEALTQVTVNATWLSFSTWASSNRQCNAIVTGRICLRNGLPVAVSATAIAANA